MECLFLFILEEAAQRSPFRNVELSKVKSNYRCDLHCTSQLNSFTCLMHPLPQKQSTIQARKHLRNMSSVENVGLELKATIWNTLHLVASDEVASRPIDDNIGQPCLAQEEVL